MRFGERLYIHCIIKDDYFLKIARKSAQLFFLTTNQIIENTPIPPVTVAPVAIPTTAIGRIGTSRTKPQHRKRQPNTLLEILNNEHKRQSCTSVAKNTATNSQPNIKSKKSLKPLITIGTNLWNTAPLTNSRFCYKGTDFQVKNTYLFIHLPFSVIFNMPSIRIELTSNKPHAGFVFTWNGFRPHSA